VSVSDAGILDRIHETGWATFPFAEDEALDQIAASLADSEAPSVDHSELRPQDQAHARPFSLSGRYGMGAFEAHTDGAHELTPPRWSVMRLVASSKTRTPTLLWDFAALALGPRVLDQLRRSMWVVHGGPQVFYTSILRPSVAGTILRFNRACMQPVSRQSAELGDHLVSSLVLASPAEHVWQPGEVLVFDNWRMLHGRPRVTQSDLESRRLERLLVSHKAGH
jgi:alpha-ketoglutarate-dependent taurine dioxygenase